MQKKRPAYRLYTILKFRNWWGGKDAKLPSFTTPRSNTYSNEIRVLGVSHGYNRVNFFDQLLLFIVLEVHVPLSQSCLSGAILDQNEPNLCDERQR